jgi:hypothetical protein
LRVLLDADEPGFDGAAATGAGAGADAGAGEEAAAAESDSAVFLGCIAQPAANMEIAAATAHAVEGNLNFTDELLVTEFGLLTHFFNAQARGLRGRCSSSNSRQRHSPRDENRPDPRCLPLRHRESARVGALLPRGIERPGGCALAHESARNVSGRVDRANVLVRGILEEGHLARPDNVASESIQFSEIKR